VELVLLYSVLAEMDEILQKSVLSLVSKLIHLIPCFILLNILVYSIIFYPFLLVLLNLADICVSASVCFY
jgi:hypothetical protein